MRWVFTMEWVVSPPPIIDLEDLGLDRGGHLLIERALRALPSGARLEVRGRDPVLGIHLRAWARARGHAFLTPSEGGRGVSAEATPPPDDIGETSAAFVVVAGEADRARWIGAERAGGSADIVQRPGATWGLAARGA